MNSVALTVLMTLAQQFPAQQKAFVDLPSGRTHYEDFGSGPAVVLIHGVSGPLQVWDKTTDALVGAGYRVIRYDLYGRGMSDRLAGAAYDLPLYVRQLEELTAALHVAAPVRLVGSSFGAVIASEYALQHPDATQGVVLVGPAGFPIQVPPLARLGDLPVLGDAMKHVLGTSLIRKQNRKYAYDVAAFKEFWPYFDAQLDVDWTTEAMLATMRNAPVTSYIESYRALGATGTPVGVIWGREDATFPYENHVALQEAIPQARLVTVEKAAHLPQWERADVAVPALVEMLAEAGRGGATGSSRVHFEAPVSTALDATPVDNAGTFDDAFFSGVTTRPRSLGLAPDVEKDYLFPTFYADVTTSVALFTVDYDEAARLLPPEVALEPLRAVPGRAVLAISSYHYARVRGMQPYNEVAIALAVKGEGDAPHAYVLSMPVTTLENRIRGRSIWGLPKDVREIGLRAVGDDFVTTLPSLTLRVPMQGTKQTREQAVTLHSVLEGRSLTSVSRAKGTFLDTSRPLVSFGVYPEEERALTLGEGPEAALLRRLRVAPVPFRTSFAQGVESYFDLPCRRSED